MTPEQIRLIRSSFAKAVPISTAVSDAFYDRLFAVAPAVRNIDAMIAVINKIAAQTQMLSLNARIEAARAGDAGRSFSVVAEEVKSLSVRTGTATRQIGAIVGAVRGEVDRANALIDRSLDQFDAANDMALEVAAASDAQRVAADNVESHAGDAAANADAATVIISKLATAATASDIIAEQIAAAVGALVDALSALPTVRAKLAA